MDRSFGQVVLLRDQTDLAEQFVHCVVGDMDASEPADASGLSANGPASPRDALAPGSTSIISSLPFIGPTAAGRR